MRKVVRPKRERHKHDWSPRGVQHNRWAGWDGGSEKTTVLYGCSGCGKLRTRKLRGLWRLEDVTVASDDALRRLVRTDA